MKKPGILLSVNTFLTVLFLLDSPTISVSYTQLGTPCDTESTELVPVVEGDNLWLVCEHSANPAPTVYWLAGAEIVSHEEELLLTNITRNSPRLYTCIAENMLGKATAELGISVLCR